MRLNNGHDLLGMMAGAAHADPVPDRSVALGYVTSPGGQVTFDEDLTETPTVLPVMGSYQAAVGDRVVLQRVNGAWLILGPIGPGSAALAAPPPVQWLFLPLATGWTNVGGVYPPAGYTKINGVVYFRGLIQKSAQSAFDTIATSGGVFAGWRSSLRRLFSANLNGSPTRIVVLPDGSLVTNSAVTPSTGVLNLGLDVIVYPAEG